MLIEPQLLNNVLTNADRAAAFELSGIEVVCGNNKTHGNQAEIFTPTHSNITFDVARDSTNIDDLIENKGGYLKKRKMEA